MRLNAKNCCIQFFSEPNPYPLDIKVVGLNDVFKWSFKYLIIAAPVGVTRSPSKPSS